MTIQPLNLWDTFLRVAQQRSAASALIYCDQVAVTFTSLLKDSERCASSLSQLGIKRGDVVGIFHTKSPACFAAMLACLRLGAPYVNLDEENPEMRLLRIIDTCKPKIILADEQLSTSANEACQLCKIPLIKLHDLPDSETYSANLHLDPVIGSDIAYLMFTSGSTGIPKGAAISHAQVLGFVSWAKREICIMENDILSNVNPMHFDNSVFDFYASLFNGAALTPVHRDVVKNPGELVKHIAKVECTVWFSVPSLLIYLMALRAFDAFVWKSIRAVVFGGEGFPIQELRKLYAHFGNDVRMINVYGPTECTCICSAHDVLLQNLDQISGYPPIGQIAPEFRALLLDDDDSVAQGETGELCLIGPHVGLGYYNDPERTAASFVRNPFCTTHHEKMYRTGDLMRIDPKDGLFYFVGRKDNQVKHMGYRIELEEIEFSLSSIQGISQCVVVLKKTHTKFSRLVAFVSVTNEAISCSSIIQSLQSTLPNYMIPSHIEIRTELPKNANGKIDRKYLENEI